MGQLIYLLKQDKVYNGSKDIVTTNKDNIKEIILILLMPCHIMQNIPSMKSYSTDTRVAKYKGGGSAAPRKLAFCKGSLA